MPGKIKALWCFCMVVIVAGFLVLVTQGEMDEASEQADAAYQLAAEEQKKIAAKTIQIDPIKYAHPVSMLLTLTVFADKHYSE